MAISKESILKLLEGTDGLEVKQGYIVKTDLGLSQTITANMPKEIVNDMGSDGIGWMTVDILDDVVTSVTATIQFDLDSLEKDIRETEDIIR